MSDVGERTLHDVRFPGESAAYRAARDRLLEAEMGLRRQVEAVAAQRRSLPPGGLVPTDFEFEEGEDARAVRLSQLFGDKRSLLLYSFMYGPAMTTACPMCTAMMDGLDGEIPHIARRAAIAVVARSPIGRFRAFAAERGWRHARLVSSANNSYNLDYHGEDAEGRQQPILNVFTRGDDGAVRHAWASELAWAPRDPGQDPRHIDPLWPLWAALDLIPEGRGDYRPSLDDA
jgi:predicted dithiol-disulfide oxidoreductase (DUF899 family)